MICEGCDVDNDTVIETEDPFDSEIYQDYTLHNLCPDCIEERAREI